MLEFALIDGSPAQGLPLADRGFAYGDGLFETMRSVDGRVPLWSLHLARLADGCRRLGLAMPDAAVLAAERDQALAAQPTALLKLVLTRGDGGRGYALPPSNRVRRVLMRHHLPPPSVDPRGLHVDHCATPLPRDSVLAGIKHLNRLHQVLARAEADARGLDEGLCGFDDGQLVCATAANLFAVVDGELRTPPVTEAGVAGVCRAALLADPWFGRDIRCTAVSREDLARASEIFLTNAVRGVLAVRRCGSREVSPGAATGAARAAMARVGLPPMAG